jgi:uncharacterized protein (DUF1499 family)
VNAVAMPWRSLTILAGCTLAGWAVTMTALSLLARRPDDLGVQDGRLAPCSRYPNCVSSQAEDASHAIEPLAFTGSPEAAWQRLKEVLAAWPRTRVVQETDGYLHAECKTFLFRFVDDVEFVLDRKAKVIHFRSAARIGAGDLGTNRRRMEAIRRAFGD